MLSIFPSLFVFGIFAPFILRTTVGVYLFYTGYRHLKEERELITEEVAQGIPRVFSPYAKPFVIIGILFEIVVGLSLIAGFLTQIMALLGMIYVVKLLILKDLYPVFAKHERVFYVVLFVIFLSLLLTGAGAPAVDLPL